MNSSAVRGEIYSNVWQTDRMLRISPVDGRVLAWVNLSGLLSAADRADNTDVLNGIACDALGDRLFVTGNRGRNSSRSKSFLNRPAQVSVKHVSLTCGGRAAAPDLSAANRWSDPSVPSETPGSRRAVKHLRARARRKALLCTIRIRNPSKEQGLAYQSAVVSVQYQREARRIVRNFTSTGKWPTTLRSMYAVS